MLTYDIDKRGKRTICQYLYESIRCDIRDGTIAPRSKLPSKRALAEHIGISVITVQNAYEQLIAEGYIVSRERSGYFVADLCGHGLSASERPKRTAAEHIYCGRTQFDANASNADTSRALVDISHGSPNPADFPFATWSRLMRRVLSEQDTRLLERVHGTGVKEVRVAISRYLFECRGICADPDTIIVGAGTEYLYNLLIQLFGRSCVFATEDPGYKKLSLILDRLGIPCVPQKIDEYGMIPKIAENVSVLHISPAHHYPTGVVMPAWRRRDIINEMVKRNGYIIEDDYDGEFGFNGKPVPTMFGEDYSQRVIYINTFAETISPSIRISYMILPEPLMRLFNEKLSFYSCSVPSFEQHTLALFISEGYLEKHVNRMRLLYRQRRDGVIKTICGLDGAAEVADATAGSNLIMRLNTDRSDSAIKEDARCLGIGISFVSDFLYRPDDRYHGMAIVNFAHNDGEKTAYALEAVAKIL